MSLQNTLSDERTVPDEAVTVQLLFRNRCNGSTAFHTAELVPDSLTVTKAISYDNFLFARVNGTI